MSYTQSEEDRRYSAHCKDCKECVSGFVCAHGRRFEDAAVKEYIRRLKAE